MIEGAILIYNLAVNKFRCSYRGQRKRKNYVFNYLHSVHGVSKTNKCLINN